MLIIIAELSNGLLRDLERIVLRQLHEKEAFVWLHQIILAWFFLAQRVSTGIILVTLTCQAGITRLILEAGGCAQPPSCWPYEVGVGKEELFTKALPSPRTTEATEGVWSLVPTVGDTKLLGHSTQKIAAGLKDPSLKTSFYRTRRCYARCQRGKASNSPTQLGLLTLIPTDRHSSHPSPKKFLFAAEGDHHRKPQEAKIQGAPALKVQVEGTERL